MSAHKPKELPPFEWNGVKLTGYSDIIGAALKLKDKKEIDRFVKSYCARGKYARQNIGYVSGYYDAETANRIMEIFKTSHPILGSKR